MITKEQLQTMSDFEVNKALALLAGEVEADNQYFELSDRGENAFIIETAGGYDFVDYCNTPNDIMLLAFEYGISLIALDDAWAATNNADSYMLDSSYRFNEVGGISFFHVSPLRAIACCLILVLQEKNV